MRRACVLVVVVVFSFSGLVPTAWAKRGDMQLQFGLLQSIPTDDLTEQGESIELDDAVGFQASFEYMATDLLGVEPAISSSGHDVALKPVAAPALNFGEIDLLALTTNLNFHFLPQKKLDLVVGPAVGYAFWGDLRVDLFSESFPAENEFIYGGHVALDVPFAEGKWAFSAALDYLFTEIALENASSDDPVLGVDPMLLKFGVSYTF